MYGARGYGWTAYAHDGSQEQYGVGVHTGLNVHVLTFAITSRDQGRHYILGTPVIYPRGVPGAAPVGTPMMIPRGVPT